MGEGFRCRLREREVEVLARVPSPKTCAFLAQVDAYLRRELAGELGGLVRAEQVLPHAYWKLFYPGALGGLVPLDLEAVTEDEVASGRARLYLDPRAQVLVAWPLPGGPEAWERRREQMGTPERLVCEVRGVPVEVSLDLEFVPTLAPEHLRHLLERFLERVSSVVEEAVGHDPGALRVAEFSGTWYLRYQGLSKGVFAVCHGPSWRAVAEGRYRLEVLYKRDSLDLCFFAPGT